MIQDNFVKEVLEEIKVEVKDILQEKVNLELELHAEETKIEDKVIKNKTKKTKKK